jgi:hypothetical protein
VTEPSPPQTFRPLAARVTAVGVAGVLVVVAGGLWLGMPAAVRADFSTTQRVTLLLVLGAILVVLWGIARTRADAGARSLTLVNVYRTRRLDWAQVVAVSLGPGQPWATLDLDDGTTVSVMAIQAADGARAQRAAAHLAGLVARRSAPPPPG